MSSFVARARAWFAVILTSRRVWLVGLFALIEYVYVYYCTAGKFLRWPEYNRYYDLLAEGFRAGHLYLPIEPSPELLAQDDPYDTKHS